MTPFKGKYISIKETYSIFIIVSVIMRHCYPSTITNIMIAVMFVVAIGMVYFNKREE